METLRCLVCQGQSIADSDAEMAGDMRALVRERIAARARSPDAIRDWLIARYGDYVTYDPPLSARSTCAAVARAARCCWRSACGSRAAVSSGRRADGLDRARVLGDRAAVAALLLALRRAAAAVVDGRRRADARRGGLCVAGQPRACRRQPVLPDATRSVSRRGAGQPAHRHIRPVRSGQRVSHGGRRAFAGW